MTQSYRNLLERLDAAAGTLAGRDGTARDRLASAFLHVTPLLTREFPPELRGAWDDLRAAMSRVEGPEGSVRATTAAMTEDEVRRCTEELLRVRAAVELRG